MQILSSALPGFRDLRGPIIAGYVWLLFAWLIVTPDIDTRPDSRIGGPLYDLAQEIGRFGVVVAVSVAAYLIGAVSGEITRALRRIRRLQPRLPFMALDRGEMQARVSQTLDMLEAPGLPDAVVRHFRDEITEREETARQEAYSELVLPATLLVGDQPLLFAEVDRLRAEGELRLAVAPPLFALTILLAVLQSPLWLIALVAVSLLWVQGWRRDEDARKVISDAVYVGRITSPSLGRFNSWLDSKQNEINQAVRAQA